MGPLRMISLASLLGLGACGTLPPGQSTRYHHLHAEPIAVSLPAHAPAIGQQFRRLPRGLEGARDIKDHLGLDVQAPRGTPVLAVADGVVSRVATGSAYGRQIDIRHGTGAGAIVSRYFHLDSQQVGEGQQVRRGEQIGTLGHTGVLAGQLDHLHYSILEAGRLRDPNLYWAGGVGQVTCFKPGMILPTEPFRATYPVICAQ